MTKPASRPEFRLVVDALRTIGQKYNILVQDVSSDPEMTPRIPRQPVSPDMHPYRELPPIPPSEHNLSFVCASDSDTPTVEEEGHQEHGSESRQNIPPEDLPRWWNRQGTGSVHEGELSESPSVETGSSSLGSGLDGDYTHIRVESPPLFGEKLVCIKDERRYRLLLQHEFHPSRKFFLI